MAGGRRAQASSVVPPAREKEKAGEWGLRQAVFLTGREDRICKTIDQQNSSPLTSGNYKKKKRDLNKERKASVPKLQEEVVIVINKKKEGSSLHCSFRADQEREKKKKTAPHQHVRMSHRASQSAVDLNLLVAEKFVGRDEEEVKMRRTEASESSRRLWGNKGAPEGRWRPGGATRSHAHHLL